MDVFVGIHPIDEKCAIPAEDFSDKLILIASQEDNSIAEKPLEPQSPKKAK